MFKLLKKEKVTSSNIKVITSDPFLVSCSDSKIKKLNEGLETDLEIPLPAATNAFACDGDNNIYVGLQDGSVRAYNTKGGRDDLLYKHSQNVCSICHRPGLLLTGSWDHDAIFYSVKEQRIISKVKHPGAVWCCKIISGNKIMTGCSDGVVRIFRDGKVDVEYPISEHAIRGCVPTKTHVYAVDNYGTVYKFEYSGRIAGMRVLNEMVFCLLKTKDDLMYACGENGMIYKIGLNLEVEEGIRIDAQTVWSLAVAERGIYAGGCNGCIYYLEDVEAGSTSKKEIDGQSISCEQLSNDQSTSNDQKTINDKSTNSDQKTINDQKTNNDHQISDQMEHSGKKPAENNETTKYFKSGGMEYKVDNGKVFLKQYGEWTCIGDNMEKWDHSFSVELENKNYTLSFNDSENVHDVASRFLSENKMNKVYHDEIVAYIQANFKKNTQYKVYNSLDFGEIAKYFHENASFTDRLERIGKGEKISIFKTDESNIYQLERALSLHRENGKTPLLVILDVCKFLVANDVFVDLAFLFNVDIRSEEEAKCFVCLLANLIKTTPFKMDRLLAKMHDLEDEGLLLAEDTYDCKENLKIKRRK